MHGIISNLEKDNLLKRKCDPQHGRILCTELTKRGLKIIKQAHVIINEIEETMTHTMSKKDKLLLGKLLSECIKTLNENKNAQI